MTTADKITQDVQRVRQVCKAVAAAIRELGEVPSGHLYANLMSHMDLATYNGIIGVLKEANLIRESGNLITWTGSR